MRKKLLLALGLLVLCGGALVSFFAPGLGRAREDEVVPGGPVRGDFAFFHAARLASPVFAGRAPATEGGDLAARYIARYFRAFGLQPAGDGGTYFQEVPCAGLTLERAGERWRVRPREGPGRFTSPNVLGFLPGKKEEIVVVSAHYDHLGKNGGTFFPGANDNASGVGVLLEVARTLSGRAERPKKTVLFAAWTLEEAGLLGSKFFAAGFPGKVEAVINLDTVGNGEEGVYVAWATGPNRLVSLLEEVGGELGLKVAPVFSSPGEGHASDHVPFSARGVPAVTLTSPAWLEANHTPGDVPALLVPSRLEAAGRLVTRVLERLAYENPLI